MLRSDYGHGPWYNLNMKEIAISKFKATCLAVLEEVRRTGTSVRITRFGQPVAEVVPARPAKKTSWLGCMRESFEVHGDISGRIGAFDSWAAARK
jgi:prevent-host-death family protein